MNVSQVSHRLRVIKHEIEELRLLPVDDLKERIKVLENINFLLKEQNRLLYIRQAFLESGI